MAKKTDLVGNPLQGSTDKKKKAVPKLTAVVKRSAAPIVIGAVAGGISTGIALAIIAKVPTLQRWAAGGGFKRAAVVTGLSVGVAGAGLVAFGKFMTPKKAVDAAPFVLGGALLTAMAPVLAAEVVARIDALIQGLFKPSTSTTTMAGTPSGKGASALGERRALTAHEMQQGQREHQRTHSQQPQTVDVDRW